MKLKGCFPIGCVSLIAFILLIIVIAVFVQGPSPSPHASPLAVATAQPKEELVVRPQPTPAVTPTSYSTPNDHEARQAIQDYWNAVGVPLASAFYENGLGIEDVKNNDAIGASSEFDKSYKSALVISTGGNVPDGWDEAGPLPRRIVD